MTWVCFVVALVIKLVDNKNGFISDTEILFASIVITLRSIIVAVRYATTSEERIKEQYNKVFTEEENNKEFLATGWGELNHNWLDEEVKASMIRNEIENLAFRTKFVTKLPKEH